MAQPSAGVTPLVELVGITKSFGDLVANDDVTLTVLPGEVHAVLGENGAGKSTLMRVLYGLTAPDRGQLQVDGRPVAYRSPAGAIAAGIGMVTQEFSLVGPMTVTENVLLGSAGRGRLDRVGGRRRVLDAAARLGVGVDPDALVERLSVGERQRVEILKALVHDCRVLILDEPTAVLTPQDSTALFAAVRRLTAQGIGVLLVSHKLQEVVEAADRISVLRRGRLTATVPAEGASPRTLAALMVGASGAGADDAVVAGDDPGAGPRSSGHGGPRSSGHGDPGGGSPAGGSGRPSRGAGPGAPVPAAAETPALEVRDVRVERGGTVTLDVPLLRLARGEIVGVAGVSGNGQTELVEVLGGVRSPVTGQVRVTGTDVTASGPAGRFAAGLGRITEDRKGSAVGAMTVEQNLVLEDLDRFRRGPFLDRRAIRAHAEAMIRDYDIRARPTDPIRGLSGGNLQKVLLARSLARDPVALVVSQPTRGLDVGACAYVHTRLRERRDAGAGVLLISEDVDEILGLADRVVVLFAGRVVGDLPAWEATVQRVGLLMAGHEAVTA